MYSIFFRILSRGDKNHLGTRCQSDDEVDAEQTADEDFAVSPDDGVFITQRCNDSFRAAKLCSKKKHHTHIRKRNRNETLQFVNNVRFRLGLPTPRIDYRFQTARTGGQP